MREEIEFYINNIDTLISQGSQNEKELLVQVNSDLSSIYSIIDKYKINASSLDVTSERLGNVTLEQYYTTTAGSLQRLFKKSKIEFR